MNSFKSNLLVWFFCIVVPYTLPAMEQPEPKTKFEQQLLQSCPICSKLFQDTDSVFVCDSTHQFHKQCLVNWLNFEGFNCPVCNKVLKKEESAQQEINFSQIVATLRAEGNSYLSWLPTELYQELKQYYNNPNQNPGRNFWLLKHADAKGLSAKTLTGHDFDILSVTCDYANNRLLSYDSKCQIILWDLETGAYIKHISFKRPTPIALFILEHHLFHPEHNWAAFADFADHTIYTYDLANEQCINTLKGHTKPITCLVFDNEHNQLFSASIDLTIKIWDLKKETCVHTLITGHTDIIDCLIVDHTHNRLISGSRDTTIKIWSLETGQELQTLNNVDEVSNLLLTSNNLIAFSLDRIKIWDLKNGVLIKTIPKKHSLTYATEYNFVSNWLFFHDKAYKKISIMDLETQTKIQNIPSHKNYLVCFTIDQKHNRLLVGYGKTIKMFLLYDPLMNQALERIPLEYPNQLNVLFQTAYNCFRNKTDLNFATDKHLLATFLLLPEEMQQTMQKYLKIIMRVAAKEELQKNDDDTNNAEPKKETWSDWLLGKPS